MTSNLKEFIVKFSGEDPQIIQKTSQPKLVERHFFWIGILVLIIYLITTISGIHFIYNLLDGNSFGAVLIGLVWGLIVANLYLLLLNSISPKLIESAERKVKGKLPKHKIGKNSILVSILFRCFFIGVLATIIAQPLNLILFSIPNTPYFDSYKLNLKTNYFIEIDSSFVKNEFLNKQNNSENNQIEDNLKQDQNILSSMKILSDSLKKRQLGEMDRINYNIELNDLINLQLYNDKEFIKFFGKDQNKNLFPILEIKKRRVEQLSTYINLFEHNNFYIARIKLIYENFLTVYLVNLLIISIFLIPIYLKYSIRHRFDFYSEKRNIEEKIITDNYLEFKNNYSGIFLNKYNEVVSFYENHIDPPFNLIPKTIENLDCIGQEELLSEIYKDNKEGFVVTNEYTEPYHEAETN